MSFPAYPSYRNSGDEWLGNIPSHWDIARLKQACKVFPSNVDKKTVEGQQGVQLCNYTDVYYNDEIRDGMPFMEASATADQIKRFELRAGDTIFTKDSESPDDIARSAYVPVDLPGVICGYHLSMARPKTETCGAFIKRYFDASSTRAYFHVKANGLTRVGLGQYAVDNAPIALPPRPEQTAIAAFLDRETAKIDTLVEEQRRLIELLKEKRKAVISHAVTNGLDPTVPMKDSGIEWLGDVPQHWDVVALRRLVDPARPITYGIVQPGELDPRGRFMVRGQDYSRGWVSGDDIFRVSDVVEAPYRRARLRLGDVVITIVGAGTGNTAVVPSFLEGANITQTTARVAPSKEVVDGAYLATMLGSQVGAIQVALYQKGAAQPGLNLEHLAAFRFPLPPLHEQTKIIEHLVPVLSQIQSLTTSAEQAMSLLIERRAAVISAAVTGKIDVRETAKVVVFPIDRARARALVAAEIIERSAHQPTFGRVKFQKIAFLAEAHVGVGELAGSYAREAAGPLDRAMIDEMERGARGIAGVTVDQAGGAGTTVCYRLHRQRGSSRQELADWLGVARTAQLDKLIADFAYLTTKGSEAVATLYSVWNDSLMAGASPTDDDIIAGFLNDWHPEKRQKFSADELPEWLEWMRRHDIVPTGSGPRTTAGSLFP